MNTKQKLMAFVRFEVAEKKVKVYPLYHCTASVIECEHGIALRSYSTIVSWYSYDECEIVHFDYWSNTTCQHMTKFNRWMLEKGYEVDNIYRLWNTRYPWAGSKENKGNRTFTKKLFKEIEEEGFYRWINHIPTYYCPLANLERYYA